MESLSISSQTLLLHHQAFRRIDPAPAGRRLHFPRPSAPRHHTVRCSHRPPPKEREVKKKGRWKAAAAAAAVAVACALGAVYLSRAAPDPGLAKQQGTVILDIKIEGDSDQNDESSGKKNPVLGRTRDELRKILFQKETYSALHLIDSWMTEPTRFDAALMVVQWHIAKKHYHSAEEVCERIRPHGSPADARPLLLMAVIKMMLAVEAMLKPETGKEDLEVFVDSAMKWWKEFHESIGSEEPNVSR